MAILFLDTNIIIRYLTQDNPAQGQRAYAFLQQVEQGSVEVTTTEAVIAEVVHVLSSKVLYGVPRQDIRTRLTAVIRLKGLKLRYKGMYLRALDLYATTNLDFVDALTVAHMERQQIATVVSFDRDFDRIPTVSRQEP
jgi:predicted nucleic acid-binding protein